MVTFAVFVGIVGWLSNAIWQLWLAETKGKVWIGIRYAYRGEVAFDTNVFFYWVALAWGAVMLFVMTIATIKQIAT